MRPHWRQSCTPCIFCAHPQLTLQADVDILMGTFTKSYASVGGYVTGTKVILSNIGFIWILFFKELIDTLRRSTYATLYSSSLAPGAAQQVLSSIIIIMGEDGTDLGTSDFFGSILTFRHAKDKHVERKQQFLP